MLEHASRTHPGCTHDHNEDAVGSAPEHDVWLVADGMGGHAAGEVASAVAVDTIIERVGEGDDLETATVRAHQAVVKSASENPAQNGMGSTSVALRIADRQAEIVWVGDSRAYLLRNERLQLLTRDHSFMQLLIQRKHLTEEQARKHPRRNVVTQVLGFNDPAPDRVETLLQHGDVVLLCSDGLNDELEDGEIAELMLAGGSLEAQAGRLIDAACDQGGKDNISVVLVRYSNEDADTLQRAVGSALSGGSPQTESEEPAAPREPWLPDPVFWGIVAALAAFIIFLLLKGGGV